MRRDVVPSIEASGQVHQRAWESVFLDSLDSQIRRLAKRETPPLCCHGRISHVFSDRTHPLIQAESADDYQISVNKLLRPRFADLRAPRVFVTSPYDGQRVSLVLFTDAPFEIKALSDDEDVARIQLQIRTKQPDGVFEPWQNLSGVVWEDGGANGNVTVVTHTDRDPQRVEFTFKGVRFTYAIERPPPTPSWGLLPQPLQRSF